MKIPKEVSDHRKTEHDINPLIISRWSPRAMSGEELTDDELMPLFEAAKWAPSSSNRQPWRFVYAKRNTKFWDDMFDVLVDFNKMWAKNASVLVTIVSERISDDGTPSKTHSFDAGAAWENLAIETISRGLVAHAMIGFDFEKARNSLKIPENFEIEAMIAIGKKGPIENIHERMRKQEFPNGRRPLKESIMEGVFRF